MKRKFKKIALLTMASILAFSVVGCSGDEANNDNNNNGNQNQEEVIVSDYLAEMKVEQRNITVQNEEGQDIVQEAELLNVDRIDDILFLQYNIGKATNCFVQNLTTPIYNDGGLVEFTYEESEVTSQSISEGVGALISTTNSTSTSITDKNVTSWGFSIGSETTIGRSLEAEMGVVSVKAELSKKYSNTVEYCKTNESERQETVESSSTNEYTNSYNITAVQERCNTVGYKFDPTKYEKGYYYALGLVADIEVYQIIVYDITNEEFISSYFISEMNPYKTAMKMLKSSTTSFDIPIEYQLAPITEIDMGDIDIPGKTVYVDLCSCYTYENASMENFEHEYYDKDTGVFTAYGNMDYARVDRYVFMGKYGLPNEKGQWIQTTINGFSIYVDSSHDIEIVFENMSFIGVNEKSAFEISNETEVNIIFNGYNKISGGKVAGENDIPTICGKNMIISGSGETTIIGANGENGVGNGVKGLNGHNGIMAENLILDIKGNLTVYGGNGGNGGNGSNGDYGNNGSNGGDGGNGSDAVKVKKLTVNVSDKGKIELIGGTGGNGGKGGNGANGRNEYIASSLNVRDYYGEQGYNGGDGGNGGTLGYGVTLGANKVIKSDNFFEVVGLYGNGGNGGNGGHGGHGNTVKAYIAFRGNVLYHMEGGQGGNGGNGGNGRMAGKGGSAGDAGKYGRDERWPGYEVFVTFNGENLSTEPVGINGVAGKDGTVKK